MTWCRRPAGRVAGASPRAVVRRRVREPFELAHHIHVRGHQVHVHRSQVRVGCLAVVYLRSAVVYLRLAAVYLRPRVMYLRTNYVNALATNPPILVDKQRVMR